MGTKFETIIHGACVGCCLLGGVAACTDRPSPAHAVEAAAPKEPVATSPGSQSQTTEPGVAFRRQFAAAARTVQPAVVSITATPAAPRTRTTSSVPTVGGALLDPPLAEEIDTGHQRRRRGVGSGTIVDSKGYILTNYHILEGVDRIRVVVGDEHEFDAKLIGSDPLTDIAVITIEPGDLKLPVAMIGDSEALQAGDWVLACGKPFGVKQMVSAGVVSAVRRSNPEISEYEDFIQTDALINSSNSGGPLIDLDGQIVGINTATVSARPEDFGVGFAIPIRMANQIMRQLLDQGKVSRGYVGLSINDLSEKLSESFDYPGAGGVLVEDVVPNGPGARAGIQPGDILSERDGAPITDAPQFRGAIAGMGPGRETVFTLWRDGSVKKVRVGLTELPGVAQVIAQGQAIEGEPRWGLQLADVPKSRKDRTKDMPDHGAVVGAVRSGSPAEDIGIHPGDVIVDLDGKLVRDAADAQRLLQSTQESIRVRIVRRGQGSFLLLTAPQRD